jgi:hypothetical protein
VEAFTSLTCFTSVECDTGLLMVSGAIAILCFSSSLAALDRARVEVE